MHMMNSILKNCNCILSDYYGEKFQGLILYGSMARGQNDNFSDIDLLVLLKKPFNYFQELRKIVELLYPIQLESKNLISAKPAAKEEFESGEILLYRRAKREGLAA
jgi:predicted nucleotidyltransferase